MSDDLELEIRSRLRRAELPEAPRALLARTAAVVATNPTASSRARELGRQGRFLLPLAAVLVIGGTAILGTGTGPRPITSDVPATPAGPAQARLSVDAAVFEWCSPGGCEFHVNLDGPGGPWPGQLTFTNLGEQAPISPALPAILAAGTYSLRTEIHVFGDAIFEGETGPRDLGTTATCTSEFEVQPDTQVVAVTLGFWLDRCAAGTVTTADASTLAGFSVFPFIDGVCGGAGGCDYRYELSGPGGTWAAIPESVKPGSQLVRSELVSMLPPGAYRLTASSHRMSEEPSPGVGHQTELGVAATCSTDFVITAETGNVNAEVSFIGEACSVEADVQGFLPTSTPGIVGPVPTNRPWSFEIVCDGAELPALTCTEVIETTLVALDAIGSDRAIAKMGVTRLCDERCSPELDGAMVTVTFTTPAGSFVIVDVFPGPDGPRWQYLGPGAATDQPSAP